MAKIRGDPRDTSVFCHARPEKYPAPAYELFCDRCTRSQKCGHPDPAIGKRKAGNMEGKEYNKKYQIGCFLAGICI